MTKGRATLERRAGERMIVLDTVAAYIRRHKESPLLKDIYIAGAIGTAQTVSDHVAALVAEGYLERYPDTRRSLKLTEKGKQALRQWQEQEHESGVSKQ